MVEYRKKGKLTEFIVLQKTKNKISSWCKPKKQHNFKEIKWKSSKRRTDEKRKG